MSTVACTAVTVVPSRDKAGVEEVLEGTLATSTDGDTITFTLPTRWIGTGFNVNSVACQKWTTGAPTLRGARTKAVQPISLVSFVESTGVISLLLGTGASISGSETARVIVKVSASQS